MAIDGRVEKFIRDMLWGTPFCRVPIWAMHLKAENGKSITPLMKLILGRVYGFDKSDGRFKMHIANLAQEFGCSKNTRNRFAETINELVALGYLKRDREPNSVDKSAVTYTVNEDRCFLSLMEDGYDFTAAFKRAKEGNGSGELSGIESPRALAAMFEPIPLCDPQSLYYEAPEDLLELAQKERDGRSAAVSAVLRNDFYSRVPMWTFAMDMTYLDRIIFGRVFGFNTFNKDKKVWLEFRMSTRSAARELGMGCGAGGNVCRHLKDLEGKGYLLSSSSSSTVSYTVNVEKCFRDSVRGGYDWRGAFSRVYQRTVEHGAEPPFPSFDDLRDALGIG